MIIRNNEIRNNAPVSFWSCKMFYVIVIVIGGSGQAGQLSSFMYLSGHSRAIKFLYAPAPPPPNRMGPETSLVGSCT
jgi:hypothetical protein